MPPGERQTRVWTVSAAPGDLAAGGADRSGGVSGNARLTSSTGALLLLLLAAEGATIPFIGPLLGAHVFIGMLLVPPVAVKMGSTGYKIVRYYTGSVPYRLAGPPPLLRRLLGPLVVAATIVVLATGIALVLARPGSAGTFLQLHKLSFIVWFALMTVHVLIHLRRAGRSVTAEWTARRPGVGGRAARGLVLVLACAVGLALGVLSLRWAAPWAQWLMASPR
jgi:hypothetical protein